MPEMHEAVGESREPFRRILLGPAGMRVQGGVFLGMRRDPVAAEVEDADLAAAGAEVDAEKSIGLHEIFAILPAT